MKNPRSISYFVFDVWLIQQLQFAPSGLTLEELIETAKIGLREAIEKYDLASNRKLAVEAVQCMRQHIENAIAD